jgi:hypothetical protein
MAILISPEGVYSVVSLVSGLGGNDQIHELVGGWFEVIDLYDGQYMVYGESAKCNQFPRNDQATSLARYVLPDGEYIAGSALVVSRYELGY